MVQAHIGSVLNDSRDSYLERRNIVTIKLNKYFVISKWAIELGPFDTKAEAKEAKWFAGEGCKVVIGSKVPARLAKNE